MLPTIESFDSIPKNFRASLRKTNSEDGSDIFDYIDEGISKSASFPGILTIAPPASGKISEGSGHLQLGFTEKPITQEASPKHEDTLKKRLVRFLNDKIRNIPLMHRTKTDNNTDLNHNQADPSKQEKLSDERKEEEEETANSARYQSKEQKKKDQKLMNSASAVYEIDELNSTLASSSSRQCIVGADLECAVSAKKRKKKTIRRTEFHPRPPFSCVPIYTTILLGLLIVLIVGAVTTIVDMRPAFIYGEPPSTTYIAINTTLISTAEPPPIPFSTLKPQ